MDDPDCSPKTEKSALNRKSWPHTYLYLASELAQLRSDHDFPVGAAVVDQYGQFVLGYNGLPRHIQEVSDDLIVHAEVNAINNAKNIPRADLDAILCDILSLLRLR